MVRVNIRDISSTGDKLLFIIEFVRNYKRVL